jgi:hypothetical protein
MKAEEVSLGFVEGFRKTLHNIEKKLLESRTSDKPIQQYKIELSHGLDIFELKKISPDFRMGKDNDGIFVDAYTQKDERARRKFGYTRIYESGTVIFNAFSMKSAKKRACYFLSWLRGNDFLIDDEKPEVVCLTQT